MLRPAHSDPRNRLPHFFGDVDCVRALMSFLTTRDQTCFGATMWFASKRAYSTLAPLIVPYLTWIGQRGPISANDDRLIPLPVGIKCALPDAVKRVQVGFPWFLSCVAAPWASLRVLELASDFAILSSRTHMKNGLASTAGNFADT